MFMSGVTSNLTGRYKTPDTSPTETLCRALHIPSDLGVIAAVNEVLSSLTRPEVWEEVGLSQDETTWLIGDMLNSFWENECEEGGIMVLPGTVLAWAGDELPENYLWCNGGVHEKWQWPELVAALDPVFIGVDQYFTVPNLDGRFPLGEGGIVGGSFDIGDDGGELKHELTIAEMPEHSHGVPKIDNAEPPEDTFYRLTYASNRTSPQQTFVEGGSAPHNNMPPYFVLRYIIYAGIEAAAE